MIQISSMPSRAFSVRLWITRSLSLLPETVTLIGADRVQQLVVTGHHPNGVLRDLTSQVVFRIGNAQIVKAAEASRKELLSGELTRGLKPSFAFLDKVEKVGGHDVRQIAVKLSKRDLAVAGPLGKLFGPDWNRVRVAVVGKRIVLLVGSDLGLFKTALVNLTEDKPGLASSKVLADQGVTAEGAQACFANDRLLDKVLADVQSGQALGVRFTPTLFINEENYANPGGADAIAAILRQVGR